MVVIVAISPKNRFCPPRGSFQRNVRVQLRFPAAMDDTAVRNKPGWSNKAAAIIAGGERTKDSVVGFGGQYSGDDEACDGEAWNMLSQSFHQAQTVLDENRFLTQEVNNNHKSKIPDNMVKNVGLIRQINGNISKVLSIYSDLSTSFSNIVRQRRGSAAVSAASGKSRAGEEDRTAEEDEHVQQMREFVFQISNSVTIYTQPEKSHNRLWLFSISIASGQELWLKGTLEPQVEMRRYRTTPLPGARAGLDQR